MFDKEKLSEELSNPKSGRPYTRRNVMKMGACALGLMALGGAGAFAYFTGNDEVANKTSVAQNLNVRVDEPVWDQQLAETGVFLEGQEEGEAKSIQVLPGQTVAKDPRVVNLSLTIPGYLFAEVHVPRANVVVADAAGNAGEQEMQDLFSFADPTSNGWVALESFSTDAESVYRYAWPEVVDATGEAETGVLFDEVTFVNLVDKQGQSGVTMVTVVGYGIQAEPFTNPGDAWDAYKKQNGIEGGKEPEPDGKSFVGDVIVNTNFIEVGDAYALAKAVGTADTLSIGDTVKTTACAEEGTIVFEQVGLIENQTYLVLPDTGEVAIEDAIKNFDVDAEMMSVFEATGQAVYENYWPFWFEGDTGRKILGPSDILTASADIAANGKSSEFYSQYNQFLIDGRPMHIDMGDGDVTTAQLIGLREDVLAGSKTYSGMTFMFENLFEDSCKLNSSFDSYRGWRDSELRFRLNPPELNSDASPYSQNNKTNDIWDSLPLGLREAVKVVQKTTVTQKYAGGTPESVLTEDALWLPSYEELYGNRFIYDEHENGFVFPSWGGESATNQAYLYFRACNNGEGVMYNATNDCLIKQWTRNGVSESFAWWTRTVDFKHMPMNYGMYIRPDGAFGEHDTVDSAIGIAPCFCF